MDDYAIKLTIDGMVGVFAEKYSRTIDDAHLLAALVRATLGRSSGPHLELLARHDQPAHFDPMPLFPKMMKLLRWAAHDRADRAFFTGARFEPTKGEPEAWREDVEATIDGRSVRVRAVGLDVVIERDELDEPEVASAAETTELEVDGGKIVWRSVTWREQFYAPLEDIITMCEESMAKGQDLIATTLT